VTETSLAVLLLTCGVLLLQTFQHLNNADFGFQRERLLTFETPLFRYTEFDKRVAYINAQLDKVRAIPGVINAGAISRIPFTNTADATFYLLEGQSRDNIPKQVALMRNVSRDYLATIGAHLVEGRFFDISDQKSDAPAAIVNEMFAKRHFAGGSALGKRFKYVELGEKGYWYIVVGVGKQIREAACWKMRSRWSIGCSSSWTRVVLTRARLPCARLLSRRPSFPPSGRPSGPWTGISR